MAQLSEVIAFQNNQRVTVAHAGFAQGTPASGEEGGEFFLGGKGGLAEGVAQVGHGGVHRGTQGFRAVFRAADVGPQGSAESVAFQDDVEIFGHNISPVQWVCGVCPFRRSLMPRTAVL